MNVTGKALRHSTRCVVPTVDFHSLTPGCSWPCGRLTSLTTRSPLVTWLCAVKGAPDKQMPHSRKSENKQAKDSTEDTRFCWAHFKATQENVSNFSKYLCSTLL